MSVFKKAERRQAKLKLGLTGPSGSGKTFSALELATGIGSKIAVIDTENASAALYADRFTFDTLALQPPYEIRKYNEAIKAAEAAGYDVLIIDSISHAWAGEGGLLAKKESLDARGGNSFTNWGSITKEHEQFKSSILHANIHLICTMRSKQEYVIEQNERGKSAPKKVGLAPVQREGFEYELATVFDIGMNHEAQVSKDRTGLFDSKIFKITQETGKILRAWLEGAKPAEVQTQATTSIGAQENASSSGMANKISRPQVERLYAIAKSAGWSKEDVKDLIKNEYDYNSTTDIEKPDYDAIWKYIEKNPIQASVK